MRRGVGGRRRALSSRFSRRPLCDFPVPAVGDRVLEGLKIVLRDPSDEEDLDVVFDGGKFRVVDTGFGREFLV